MSNIATFGGEKINLDDVKALWMKASNCVVKGLRTPTLNDEVNPAIEYHQRQSDAVSATKDIQAMMDTNKSSQLIIIHERDWNKHGIFAKTINGVKHIAQIANPFKARAMEIIDEQEKQALADVETVSEFEKRDESFAQQIAELKAFQEMVMGDEEVKALIMSKTAQNQDDAKKVAKTKVKAA